MRCILHTETDPAFNMAAEEYLLKNGSDDYFMLWRNRKAIVVGRNQNALAQIDPDMVEKQGIRVVRRISGGGAVYHDLGNINYTFIRSTHGSFTIDYAPYTGPMLSFLNRLGVAAAPDGRSDLIVDGLKISGNAQHIHKQRMLHHGTLLFDTDLAMLGAALRVNTAGYHDRAIDSMRRPVTNIRSHLAQPISVSAFMEQLMDTIRKTYGGRSETLSTADRTAIADLADSKYKRWEWNFGSAPDYRFRKSTHAVGGVLTVCMEVQKGIIRSLRLAGGDLGLGDVAQIESLLSGCRHDRRCVKERLGRIASRLSNNGSWVERLLKTLF